LSTGCQAQLSDYRPVEVVSPPKSERSLGMRGGSRHSIHYGHSIHWDRSPLGSEVENGIKLKKLAQGWYPTNDLLSLPLSDRPVGTFQTTLLLLSNRPVDHTAEGLEIYSPMSG
jgi:hypothetical protein